MLWLDIEDNPSHNCGWGVDFASNCQYMVELVQAIRDNGRTPGIYASHYMWNRIFGSADACQKFTDVPLWYAHYDSKQTFSDYPAYPFGGWTQPAIKQFTDG